MTNSAVTQNLAFDNSMKSEAGALMVLNKTIESYVTKNPLLAFAIEYKSQSKFIGVCGMSLVDKYSVEIFYAFLPDFWGKGLATETLIALRDYLMTFKDIKKLHGYIRPSNIASIKVVEKAKFVRKTLVDKEYFSEKVYLYTFNNTANS